MPTSTGKKLGRPPRPDEEKKRLQDAFIELKEKGVSDRQISEQLGVSTSTLYQWKSETEFASRSACAREASAEIFDNKDIAIGIQLEKIGKDAISSGTEVPKGAVQALTAAQQTYRRQAAIRNPRKFSERQSIDVSGGLDINVPEGLGAVYERFGIKTN